MSTGGTTATTGCSPLGDPSVHADEHLRFGDVSDERSDARPSDRRAFWSRTPDRDNQRHHVGDDKMTTGLENERWVYGFDQIGEAQEAVDGDWDRVRGLLGGKGANLAT